MSALFVTSALLVALHEVMSLHGLRAPRGHRLKEKERLQLLRRALHLCSGEEIEVPPMGDALRRRNKIINEELDVESKGRKDISFIFLS
jgi:hypothetical protein